MAAPLFQLSSQALPPNPFVAAFVGREKISEPYVFDIGFTLVGAPSLDLEDCVGKRATLTLDHGPGEPPFVFHGVIASVELVHAYNGHTLYQAQVVPELYKLKLTHHNRIFTDVSIPQIIEGVLKEAGFGSDDYRLELVESYPKLEHVCQYRESYFDFISRLMEREGMYYYFEHGSAREVLVITDHKIKHAPLAQSPIKYSSSPDGDTSGGESLRTFRAKAQVLPKAVHLREYDYNNPQLDLTSEAEVTAQGSGNIVLYGEHYTTPNEGARYAKVRAEELLATRTVAQGAGWQYYLRSGYLFTLDQHPAPNLNRDYLAVEVEHVGKDGGSQYLELLFGRDQKDQYRAAVRAIPADVQFRAPRTTPWPRIDGAVDGIVDGSGDGPYAQIDDHGRYKVRVFFDEGDVVDGSNSTWIRMLQPHGGSPEGFHMPLHKDTEVHIVFLGGHPDRPAIVGAAHNTTKPSAVNAANHTQHVLRTHANNILILEDMGGAEWIQLATPACNSFLHLGMPGWGSGHNFDLNTDCKGRIHTGDSLEMFVDTWKHEIVGDKIDEQYVGPFTTTVNNAVTQTYQSTFDLSVTGNTTIHYMSQLELDVDASADEHYHATLDTTVDADLTETFNANQTTTVAVDQTLNVGANQTIDIGANQELTIGANQTIDVGAAVSESIGATYDLDVAGALTVTSPDVTVHANSTCEYNVGSTCVFNVGATMTVNVPNWEVNSSGWWDWSALSGQGTGLSMALTGITLSATGMSRTATGTSLAMTGVSVSLVGVSFTAGAIDLGSHFKIEL